MPEENGSQVLAILDKLFDHLSGFTEHEPRLRKVEFRTSVMWYTLGGILIFILIPLMLHRGKVLIDIFFAGS